MDAAGTESVKPRPVTENDVQQWAKEHSCVVLTRHQLYQFKNDLDEHRIKVSQETNDLHECVWKWFRSIGVDLY